MIEALILTFTVGPVLGFLIAAAFYGAVALPFVVAFVAVILIIRAKRSFVAFLIEERELWR